MDQGHGTSTPTASPAATVAPPRIPIGDRGEWLRDAALALGVSGPVAGEFAKSGCMQLGDIGFLAHPLHQPEGPWALVAHIPRPSSVSESTWMSAMLAANTQITLVKDAAFALDKDGDGILVLRPPLEHVEDPLLFSTDLLGALTASLNLRNMTQSAPASADVGQPAQPVREPENDFDVAAALDVPASTVELLRDARGFLGLERVSAFGTDGVDRLRIKGHEVSIACNLAANVLVVAVDLGADSLGDAQRCRAALLANAELLLFLGVSVAAVGSDCQLIGRFHAADTSGNLLAHWLEGFAEIATSLRADTGQKLRSKKNQLSSLRNRT